MQHRQNRSCPDTGAEQDHRLLCGLQNEASTRRAHVENVAYTNTLLEVSSPCAVRLDFHADSIALSRKRTRERVAAKKRRGARGRSKTQDHVLPRQRGW